MKARRFKKLRGFTLAETVISFAVVGVCLLLTVTAIMASVGVRRKYEAKRFFVFETENYLECYKLGGSAGFSENVSLYTDVGAVESVSEEKTIYVYYYTATFEQTADDSAAKYSFTVTIEKSFFAESVDLKTGKTVYSSEEPYVSRFDIL